MTRVRKANTWETGTEKGHLLIHSNTQTYTQKHIICQLKHRKVNNVCVDADIKTLVFIIYSAWITCSDKQVHQIKTAHGLAFSCIFNAVNIAKLNTARKQKRRNEREKGKKKCYLDFISVSVWNEEQTVCFCVTCHGKMRIFKY